MRSRPSRVRAGAQAPGLQSASERESRHAGRSCTGSDPRDPGERASPLPPRRSGRGPAARRPGPWWPRAKPQRRSEHRPSCSTRSPEPQGQSGRGRGTWRGTQLPARKAQGRPHRDSVCPLLPQPRALGGSVSSDENWGAEGLHEDGLTQCGPGCLFLPSQSTPPQGRPLPTGPVGGT